MFTHGRILKPLKTRTTGGLGKIFCFVQTKIRFRNKKTKKNKQKCEECPWVAQSAHSEHGPFWTWRILKMQHNVFCITSTHVLMPLYQIFICGEGASRVRKRNVMKKSGVWHRRTWTWKLLLRDSSEKKTKLVSAASCGWWSGLISDQKGPFYWVPLK